MWAHWSARRGTQALGSSDDVSDELAPFRSPADTARSTPVTVALILVLVCSFLSRFSVVVVGFHLRPEHLATTTLLIASVWVADVRRRLLTVARSSALVALLVFLLWSLVATVAFAPDFHRSLSILVWLGSDYILLVCLLANVDQLTIIERVGSGLAVGWALVGVFLWIIAESGMAAVGVQLDSVYHHWAAFVTAIEANIFAVMVALWTLIALSRWRQKDWLVLLLAIAMPWAIVAAQTRAALIALAVGLAILLVGSRDRRGRAAAGAVLVGILAAYGIAAIVTIPAAGIGTSPHPVPSASNSSKAPSPGTPTPSSPPSPPPSSSPANPATKFGQLSLSSGTGGYRRLVWDLAFRDMHRWRLVLGNGVNTFGQRHDDPTRKGVPGYLMTLPLQIVYDSGLVGLALLLIFFVLLFREVPSRRRMLALALGAVFAITSLSTSTFWLSTTWIVMALMVQPFRPDST
jgi:hypothetical protein